MKTKRCDCLKRFDFYKDTPRNLAQPTVLGASMSTGFLIMLATLSFYQLIEFTSYQKSSEMLIGSAERDQDVSWNYIRVTKTFTLVYTAHWPHAA